MFRYEAVWLYDFTILGYLQLITFIFSGRFLGSNWAHLSGNGYHKIHAHLLAMACIFMAQIDRARHAG